jgi:serine/threonine protein kinase/beta-lactam-binding protein with PASTA domain
MDTALSQPVGQLLGGRYHVGSRIARGGMATVYLGTDTRLDRVIALKIAHPELSDDAEFVRRFIGEARSAARLSSPNVVGIFDQGSDKRLHYIAMEYVPGRTLRQLLNERGRLSPREALDIMTGVLAGLAAAHDAGFAHRDVKPENVLLAPNGAVKVADFGLARAVTGAVQTKGGMIIGTAAYLAPEQVSGGTSDARTDVYAAGIMLFELLTGVQPHTAESPLAVAYKHVNEVVPAPSSVLPGLSGPVDHLVAMATSRDPDLRPADAGQFLRAVQEVLEARPQRGSVSYQSGTHDSGPYGPPAPYAAAQPYPGPGPYHDSGSYGDPAVMHGSAPASQPAAYSGPMSYPGQETYQEHPSFPGTAPYPTGSGSYSTPVPGRSDHYSTPYPTPDLPSTSGPVGASALPSLTPQSMAAGPARPGDGEVNHTLVVSDSGLLADFDDPAGPGGYRDSGYRGGGRYRSPRTARQRFEPRLGSYLFSRRLGYIAAGVAVVVLLAFLGWWVSSGRYQTVPSLRGQTVSAARAQLRSMGLQVTFGKPRTNPLVPKGDVIKTFPHRGSQVASGDTVKLVVSLGPVLLQVPNVSGQPLASAQAALRAAHLTPGTVKQAVSSSVPAGYVIGTVPRAYAKCPRHQPVVLLESAGPGLPNFVGMQVQDASAEASAGGYQINAIADKKGSQPANTIVRQSPPPNTPITAGEVVTVYYSPGPPGVPVPDVKGMDVTQAMLVLHQAGFQVQVNQQGPGSKVGSYSPTGVAPKGSTITLNVGWFAGGF